MDKLPKDVRLKNYLSDNIKLFARAFLTELKPMKIGMEVETGYKILDEIRYSSPFIDVTTDPSLHNTPDETEYVTGIIKDYNTILDFFEFILALDLSDSINKVRHEFESVRRKVPEHVAGVHVHISGYPFTRDFIVALYCLLYRLQQDIMGITNAFYFDPEYKVKNAHARLLPYLYADLVGKPKEEMVKELHHRIKMLFAGSYVIKKGDLYHKHKRRFSKYYMFNFTHVYSIYENKTTVEFRCFPVTLDFKILLTWALIPIYIFRYAYQNTDFILEHLHTKKITLEQVIKSTHKTFLGDEVLKTIGKLKEIATKAAIKSFVENDSGRDFFKEVIKNINEKDNKKAEIPKQENKKLQKSS